MYRIFRSQELQDEFDKNGLVRLPLLTEVQVDALQRSYDTLAAAHERIGLPFTTTSHSNDQELIRQADAYIAAVMAPEMDKVLCDYQRLFGNFLIKQTGSGSATPLHQDTTFVDEDRYRSISVWVSLVDTDRTNGCMRFVKGSHRFHHFLRPTHGYAWPYEPVRAELEALLEDYPSRRGEAFIFDHAVIHASYPNLSDRPRVAAVMAAYPQEAELIMYYAQGDDPQQLGRYNMSREAYLRFVKGESPQAQLTRVVHADHTPVTPAALRRMTGRPLSWIERLRAALGT
ncbi:MAG: phytanoyl-CoA dioxygenase family protein [Bacteroidetes bacterium]|nr:phytanoyl-CoA dioxygenase family protein [Bacteroidota bacterium]